jgi:hypothetical protein
MFTQQGFLVCSLAAFLTAAAARAETLEKLIDERICDVVERLDLIRASPGRTDGLNRYLIVSPKDDPNQYVQCKFVDRDRRMRCEVASGFYLSKAEAPRRYFLSPDRIDAIARLGFSTDGSAGNFQREIATPDARAHTNAGKLILTALHAAFSIRQSTPLEFTTSILFDKSFARCRSIS